jgi:predicted ArsR family transcriptional regulator
MDARAVYKVLGDDTRFAIYRELTGATVPLSATEIAERLGLHPNTVRPHLDRMREVGLIEVDTIHRGTVGRPQHRYSVASGAPGLGLEPPAHTLLAGLLAALAEQLGGGSDDATEIGRAWGREAAGRTRSRTCLAVLSGELDRLGFEPVDEPLDGDGHRVKVSFLHCPFRELAEAYPELVCNLHRGLVEGIVSRTGRGMVEHFNTLYDRDPCNATVVVGRPGATSGVAARDAG